MVLPARSGLGGQVQVDRALGRSLGWVFLEAKATAVICMFVLLEDPSSWLSELLRSPMRVT